MPVPDDSEIPTSVAVQLLQTMKQLSADQRVILDYIRDHVIFLDTEVQPMLASYARMLDARAKAEAEADAALLTSGKQLTAAQQEQSAEQLRMQTDRDNRVDRLLIQATSPDNVKAVLRFLLPFLLGGGAFGGASWYSAWLHPQGTQAVIQTIGTHSDSPPSPPLTQTPDPVETP